MLQPVARRGSVAVVSVLRRTAMEGTKYSERESAAEVRPPSLPSSLLSRWLDGVDSGG